MKHRRFIAFAILAILVFAGVAFYGDINETLHRIYGFPLKYWLIALGLALANYLIRWLRWTYYLRLLGISIGPASSALIFASGLAMAISPGRLGELTKSYFLKEQLNIPVARSSAAVVTERFTDVIAVLLLSTWGLFLVPYGWIAFPIVVAGAGMALFFLASTWGAKGLNMLPIPQGVKCFLGTSREAFRQVLSPKPLALAVALSMVAWLAEGAALWFVLQGLGIPASFGAAVSIYAAATLLGALTLLPGGLIGTEGSMIALLQQLNISSADASAGTLIIRLCTLWFAVVIGVLAIMYLYLMMSRRGGPSPVTDGAEESLVDGS